MIAILSDRDSWLNAYVPELIRSWEAQDHQVIWAHESTDLGAGDFCFYLSYGKIVPATVLMRYRHNLVVHESDLPQGRGWSPLSWQILEGKDRIAVTLFEARENVDSGAIYAQEWLHFEGHELVGELRAAQARATALLCERFISEYPGIVGDAREQIGEGSFYPRRRPGDSRLDPARSFADQFDLLRIVDNEQYPAFFEHRGHRYDITIRKASQS